MGLAAALPAIAVGTGVLGAVSSAQQARSQNRAARRAEDSARAAASATQRQIAIRTAAQRAAREQEARRVRGAILAAAGETGFDASSGDVVAAISGGAELANEDLATILLNARAEMDRADSELQANLASIDARRVSTPMQALTGGLSGFSSGLQIGQGLDAIFGSLSPTGTPDPYYGSVSRGANRPR